MADYYTLYFDGSCGPKNPGGTAAYGYTLHKAAEEIAIGDGVLGEGPQMSNNVAEYAGLYEGLAALAEHLGKDFPPTYLTVRGDSRLVIQQMTGEWKARGGLYLQNYKLALGLAENLRRRGVKFSFEWIPREANQRCDGLSKNHR